MKVNKKLIIVTLILLSLFMIGAVSAASDTETSVNSDVSNEKVSHNVADKNTDTISEKKSVSTKEDDDKLSNKPDNEILKDDEKTFNELRQNITDAGEGDTTITLQHDYVQDGYAEIVIDPNQKITIHGNGHTLDAKGKSRIFYVVGELILENLKIINGYSESTGGAIETCPYSNMTIINCTFLNNTAENYGGAIDINEYNIVTITNSQFINNTVINGYGGGAIYISSNNQVNLINNLFKKNYDSSGCAIDGSSSYSISGVNNVFIDNKPGVSTDIGAKTVPEGSFSELYAILTTGTTGPKTLTIDYTYNKTSGSSDYEFIGGIPINTTVHIIGNGHTISGDETARIFRVTNGGNLTLENLKLINGQGQTETTNYGDVNVGGAIYANNAKIILINTTFNQNTATDDGGAIFAGNGATVNINNTQFTNNTATYGGGAIYAETSATVNINNTQFNKNTANYGGAIDACLYTTVNINNTQFTNNTATRDGGAIDAETSATVNINNTKFTENTATTLGGAISATDATVNIENTQFTKNAADGNGGAIDAEDHTTVNINNTTFNQNTAKSYGGAIDAETSATVNINNTQFNKNTANYGGAIMVYEGDGTVVNCNFTENQAKYDGSAICITLYDFTIINSKLTDNNINLNNYKINTDCVIDLLTNKFNVDIPDFVYEGLSVLINITGVDPIFDGNITVDIKNINNDQTQDQVNVTIKNGEGTKTIDLPIGTYTATFNNLLNGNNLLTKEFMVIGNNSFVALNKNIIDTENTLTITHNYTYDPLTDSEFIGGIPINTTVHIIGNGYTIDGNHSARIFNVKSNGNLTLENLNLINGYNEKGYGGAIYTSTGSILTVNNCNFSNNTANDGGAISRGNATNCTFSYNTANSAGAIYYGNAINCTFSYNTANNVGGAISRGNAINCTFSYNTASGEGGAIYAITSDILNITNCIFDHNTATGYSSSGGAIAGVKVNVTNCTFINNSATRYGGAMSGGTATNCTFTNNTAKTGGGLNDGTAINCTFEHNVADVGSAMNKGAAIFCIFDEDNTCTDDTTFPVLDASDFTTTYQSGEKLIFNVTCQGKEYTDIPTNITVKKDPDSPGDSYTALTGKDNGWTIPNTLTPGTYTVILSYDKYPEIANKTVKLTVKDTTNIDIATDTVIAHQENTATITLTNSTSAPIGNQNINITITDEYGNTLFNGTKTTMSTGAVSISYTPITNGTININVLFEGSSTYAGASKNKTVNVNNISTSLTLNVEDTTVGATKNITVTIYDANNKAVNGTVILSFDDGTDDMEITLDGENTTFQKEYTNTNIGKTVKVTAQYIPSTNSAYDPSTDTKTFNVIKYPTRFTIENINDITEGDTINLIINEANNYTGPVTVNIGSENYTVTLTDGSGKTSITNLKPGTYTATINFPGNDEYENASANSNSFKVNSKPSPTPSKISTKIVAKQKTFKLSNKNKKYTITLKDNNNKAIKNARVTLKVKGKTYKAKTNNKGKATFKLTKLNKKGTYKATIKYNGNKKYKKSSKKVKITIQFQNIGKNSKNKALVKKIQKSLKQKGYYKHAGKYYLMIDGKYQTWTTKEVKRYQKNHGLKVTGTVDDQTAQKLGII